MSQLVSKIQYKNCEAGEFFHIAERTFDETIQLIRDYPWATERQMTSVHLTCPSVTIEHPSGYFLKLGTYYNNKFSLYYLDSSGVVSQKIILSLDEGFHLISDFYNNKDISHEFQQLHFAWNNKKHFVTSRFEYTITGEKIIRYLLFPEFFYIIYVVWLAYVHPHRMDFWGGLLAIIFTITLFTGANYYLFLNYYFCSRDLYLQISKGHPRFLFGPKEAPVEYSKEDIEIVYVYRNTRPRCPWGSYCVYDICFKNGYRFHFPACYLMKVQ